MGSEKSILDKFRLDGKNALITGGERGIGFAIAEAFAQAGANIAVAGIDDESAKNAKTEIEKYGRDFLYIHTDVTKEEEVISMACKVREAMGGIDVLCNNAGISKRAEAAEMPLEIWNRVLNINLTGQFLVSREIGGIMLEQGYGSVVNIASMSGAIVNTPLSQCNYNASKAGVIQLTKSMACEWAKRGIRVNAIAPGYIRTPITEHRFIDPGDPAVPIWRNMTPMGREGRPEELCGAALYLASDASTYTTGSVLFVDGGYTAW
jgi:NAD(P)-dependent dehydrogenase (short-subunit alcohol dehydrogenase family)